MHTRDILLAMLRQNVSRLEFICLSSRGVELRGHDIARPSPENEEQISSTNAALVRRLNTIRHFLILIHRISGREE